MSEPKDPERLLAEALKAQARSAPHPGSRSGGWPQFGLLSGADASSLERERAALDQTAAKQPAAKQRATAPLSTDPHPARAPQLPATRRILPLARHLPAYWVLLLAALLGLATGAVIGLVTLL